MHEPQSPAAARRSRVLVTGGAGFIGSNLAHRLAGEGHEVTVLDTLARPGVEANLAWLSASHGERIRHVKADIRDRDAVEDGGARCLRRVSLRRAGGGDDQPQRPARRLRHQCGRHLHAARGAAPPRAAACPLVFASTNKVYGDLADVPLQLARERLPAGRRRTRARMALPRTGGWISTRPMAAPRARRTSMCWTMREASACPPPCCA